ncbi:pyrimidine reductase family protein [Mycobacterium lepromatosis]|uniref:Bifunctional enzyme riboflavinbiosynthesis protein RibD n=1 Tax=Mycobacterium lepromatosis TaxID=480418 RepID=A0A0F4EQY2_9MYCO|nr:pyrimidine reductase family protein [Mycobacterium lepromatosis]KJX75179.1 bifunctional enzyme riboflavinbiosynthesis protein RibD [Mycobacterium lepromatosis]UKN42443.1 pyrimidine reductase family protein [Mycobacterium lepromatosis]
MSDFETGTAASTTAGRAAQTPLLMLTSGRHLDEDELPQLYGYPSERDGVWVRANFITSMDGSATADGRTGAMAGPGDRFVFNMLRELADVVVVGAGTVRIESYSGVHLPVTKRQQRQARGQSEVPQLAIVTKSGRLDRNMAVFTQNEVAPLVLTCTKTARALGPQFADLANVVSCSGDDPSKVDETAILAALKARGLCRVLTEGGPMLLGSFIQRGMLDELCLTIAPLIVGGRAQRIATCPDQLLARMRCAHVLTDDAGYLYTRYVKA